MDVQKVIVKFPWTTIGTLLMNVVTLTTLVVVAITDGHGIGKIISVLPEALLIMNLAAFMVFPFIDLYETCKDKKMCKVLGADYQSEFVTFFSAYLLSWRMCVLELF